MPFSAALQNVNFVFTGSGIREFPFCRIFSNAPVTHGILMGLWLIAKVLPNCRRMTRRQENCTISAWPICEVFGEQCQRTVEFQNQQR